MKRVGQHSDIKNCPFRAVATYQEGRTALRHQAEENFPAMEKATESLTQDNHSRQSINSRQEKRKNGNNGSKRITTEKNSRLAICQVGNLTSNQMDMQLVE